ncbi:MAG: peptidoglycan DD-metalloendopeptidase family protein [Bacteroidaceae bacterium]|nr:peptidoglycan DD-metalloendopeptidase family protein [Bacteroidaceae bacterium]
MNINKNVVSLLAVGIMACVNLTVQAQNATDKHNQHHQDLLQNQIAVYEEINLLDTLAMKELEISDKLSLASELYGNDWNQERVNPYNASKMELPDSMIIDLSNYCIPHNGYITSNYGWRRRRMHRGIDIKVQTGDTIRAAFDGKIRLTKYERRGYGYYVIIRHDNGLETIYGHLSKFLVKPDQEVVAGEPIALGGNTGRSTGSHLHFETRYLGMDINPNAIFDFNNKTIKVNQFSFSPKLLASKGPSAIHVNGTKYGYNNGKSGGSGTATYRVRKGDTLSRIAQRNGTTVNRLCNLNGIKKTSTLRPGQVLRLR